MAGGQAGIPRVTSSCEDAALSYRNELRSPPPTNRFAWHRPVPSERLQPRQGIPCMAVAAGAAPTDAPCRDRRLPSVAAIEEPRFPQAACVGLLALPQGHIQLSNAICLPARWVTGRCARARRSSTATCSALTRKDRYSCRQISSDTSGSPALRHRFRVANAHPASGRISTISNSGGACTQQCRPRSSERKHATLL